MKNLPDERTKYRLWHQLVESYIYWLLIQKGISTLLKIEAEWNLLFARLAYKHYKIIEPLEWFIQ